MKMLRSILALILALGLLLSLAACGGKKKDTPSGSFAGVWTGSWEYNGNSFTESITLSDDSTYTSVLYKNGEVYRSESGTYEYSDELLELHPQGIESQSTVYTYKNGKLVNNGHEMTRQ